MKDTYDTGYLIMSIFIYPREIILVYLKENETFNFRHACENVVNILRWRKSSLIIHLRFFTGVYSNSKRRYDKTARADWNSR